ncbi:glycoside hydrolase family 38 C-terminal domain-containing protein [Bacillus sp. JJ1533]|uniref:alpha-mannosidase n=1 Tax=Bacillus sp. JJ1533 TaxID=3122959 RepID=UPI002FFDC1A0
MNNAKQVYVYHHTHWDREWWATMQDLRIRLVELVDELLDTLEEDPEFRCFLLDGQTIVLKDYLEVRPENQERLVKLIRENRIQCGPWYILPDEFLVSGEAHIRNFWLGERMAEKLNIQNETVGYIPDTFGHISQMPQILQGFGIDNALLWRGTGGSPEEFKQEFSWRAPDGSEVLAYWFPDGYYVVDFLHFDNPKKTYDETFGRVKRSLDKWAKIATTQSLLMPYGGDHRLIDKRLPRLIKEVNEELGEHYQFNWATTKEFIDSIKEQKPELTTITGELRDFGADLPHVLPGVLSTRLYLKQRNFEGQNWLERYAEPFSALAWKYGKKYESNLLWTSWELLIQNHPHDSICGCSIDQVHREMIPRFDQSKQIAEIITEKSVQYINSLIDTSRFKHGEMLVIHNPLTWKRTDMVQLLIAEDLGIHPRTHMIQDAEGNEIPFQVKSIGTTRPMTDRYQFTEITFVAEQVPALGYKTFHLVKRDQELDPKLKFFTAIQETAKLKGSEQVTDLRLGGNSIENQFLKVEVMLDTGALTVLDKQTGHVYQGLNIFEDGGDAGDEYSYSGPLNDVVLRSDSSNERVHVSVHEAGHAKVTLKVDIDWKLPKEISEDRLSRKSEYVATRISTYITLASLSKRVDIRTEWENETKDYRLRVLFPLGEEVSDSEAEGHFDVVKRPVYVEDKGNGWPEPRVMTMPQQGYVSLQGKVKAFTIANKGLPEFEVLEDGTGTAAITLLRAVGYLSREDTLVREGGAGAYTGVPDAQCLGKVVTEYAFIPHEGNLLEEKAYETSHEFLSPLYGSITDIHDGTLPLEKGFIELKGDHSFLLSSCKKAEKSERMIIRFWNTAKVETSALVKLETTPARVYKVDLKEEMIEELELKNDGSFFLEAKGSEIVTLAIEFSS